MQRKEQLDDNPYYILAKRKFLDAYKKSKDYEMNFSPEVIDSYLENKQSLIASTVDLLKLGVECVNEASIVALILDDDFYEVKKKDLLEVLEESEYRLLIKEDEKESEKTEPITETYYSEEYNMHPYGMQMPPMNSMMLNAMNMYPFPPYLIMNPYSMQRISDVYPSSPERKGILADLTNIQRRILLLEQEKNGAKDDVSQFKQKYEELQNSLNEKEDNYSSQILELESTLEVLEKEKQELEQKMSTMEQSSGEMLQRHRDNEKWINNAKEELRLAKENLAGVNMEKDELNQRINELTKEKDKESADKKVFEQRVKELSSEVERLKNESFANSKKTEDEYKIAEETWKKKNEDAMREIKELKCSSEEENVKNLQKIQELEQRLSEEKERTKKAYSKCDDLQIENKALRSVNQEADKGKRSYEEKISSLEQDLQSKNKLSAECDKLRRDILDKEKALESLRRDLKKKNEQTDSLQKKCAELETIAYTDSKTKALNSNAFNRDFKKIPKERIIFAMVGIFRLKEINYTQGKDVGDYTIMTVASLLMDYFNNGVYRVMGDQFAIILQNTNVQATLSKLDTICGTLNEQEIGIYYGVSSGRDSNNHADLIEIAEDYMINMRNEGYMQMGSDAEMSDSYDAYDEPTSYNAPKPSDKQNTYSEPSSYSNNAGYNNQSYSSPEPPIAGVMEAISEEELISQFMSNKG